VPPQELKLGKKPHVEDSRDLMLGRFLDLSRLPVPPETFTYAGVIEDGEWGMLLNDRLDSCAPAGAIHSQLGLSRIGDHNPDFNDACCELAYEEMGGYVIGDPATDQGCDLRDVAKVWQKVGLADASGHRHRCGFYLWLEPGNLVELKIATYLFKTGCLGFRLTQNAQEAYWAAEGAGTKPVWNFDPASPEVGGHAVPEFGPVEEGCWDGVSWGSGVDIADAYIENQMDSGFVVITHADLDVTGQVEGFDSEAVQGHVKALKREFAGAVAA